MIFFLDKTKGQIIILIKHGFVFANSLFSCVGLLLINVSEFLIKPAIYTRVAWLRARVCVETTGKAYTEAYNVWGTWFLSPTDLKYNEIKNYFRNTESQTV